MNKQKVMQIGMQTLQSTTPPIISQLQREKSNLTLETPSRGHLDHVLQRDRKGTEGSGLV